MNPLYVLALGHNNIISHSVDCPREWEVSTPAQTQEKKGFRNILYYITKGKDRQQSQPPNVTFMMTLFITSELNYLVEQLALVQHGLTWASMG